MRGPLRGLAAAQAILLIACSPGGAEATALQDGSTSEATGSTGDATGSAGEVPLPAQDVLFSDRLLNIAHAGGKGTRPEHTMLAYETALADGADVLELDVHATSDGVLIAMHDDTVDRTTDGTGAVSDMTLAQLQSLDAGYSFAPDGGSTFPYRGMGLRIPTVEEVFTAFPDVPYVIEIKQGSPSIVEPLLQACRDHGIDDQVVISGFDGNVMEELRAAAPQIPTGFSLPEVIEFMSVTEQTEADYVPPGQFLQVPIDQGGIQVLTPAFVARADRMGLKVHAWTINEASEMHELIDMGVDGIITDFPARLRDL